MTGPAGVVLTAAAGPLPGGLTWTAVLLPAVLAGAAAAVAVGLPGPGRLGALLPPGGRAGQLSGRGSGRGSRSGSGQVSRRWPGGRWRRRFAAAGPAALAGGGGLLVLGPVGGPLVAVLTAVAVRALGARRVAAAREAERGGAVEACTVLAAELGTGRTPADALEAAAGVAVGPVAAALVAASSAVRCGGDVPAVLTAAAPRSAVPDLLRGLAACWALCSATGAGLAASVERLADGVRAEQAQRREVAAELAGPQATAGLLAVLPLAGTVLAAGLGARPWQVLLHTPLGAGCLLLGVGLDLLGLWWTGRLVARAGGAA